MGVFGGFGLDWDVGRGERGDVVLVGICRGGLMLAAVEHVETDSLGVRGVRGSVDDNSLVCGRDLGICRLCEISEEDVVPEGGTGGRSDVLDVKNAVFELLIEDSGLYLEGGLRGLERFAESDEAGGCAWCEIERVKKAEDEGDGGDDGDDADEVDGTHTAGTHGGYLAVSG